MTLWLTTAAHRTAGVGRPASSVAWTVSSTGSPGTNAPPPAAGLRVEAELQHLARLAVDQPLGDRLEVDPALGVGRLLEHRDPGHAAELRVARVETSSVGLPGSSDGPLVGDGRPRVYAPTSTERFFPAVQRLHLELARRARVTPSGTFSTTPSAFAGGSS